MTDSSSKSNSYVLIFNIIIKNNTKHKKTQYKDGIKKYGSLLDTWRKDIYL